MSTQEIINYITGATFEQLPNEVAAAAKIPILDCLGVTLAGSQEEACNIIDIITRQGGGNPEAGVIGGGYKTSASEAAWANGTRAHILDYDDYYLPYHPTVAILPAVLATAEKYHLSGKDVLLGYIAGFEVQASIVTVTGRQHYDRGWHSTPVLGSLGAAAAAANMLHLDERKTRMALGIAASYAGGLRRNFGSMTKSLHAGNAARNGVVAANLAQNGYTADSNILEGPLGFIDVLGKGGKRGIEEMGRELGKSYYLVTDGVSIKPYPSCAATHWAIDAAFELRKQFEVKAGNIAEIECRTDSGMPHVLIHHRPKKGLEGKFSLEYCISIALLDGDVCLKHFTDERVQAPAVQELINKVKYAHPPEMGSEPGAAYEMVIKLKDGRTFSKTVKHPKGTPANPISLGELSRKFRDCAGQRLSPGDTDSALEQISALETIKDITGIMGLFTFLHK